MVGADLSVMARDADRVRSGRRVIFSSLREHPGAPEVSDWVRAAGPVPGGGLSGSVRVSRLTARAAVASRADATGRSRVTVLRSDGPLALRETPLGVYLVGTAAGPLGGDDLALDIDVGPGASLVIRSAAAMLLLPGPDGGESALRISARVGPGGRLDFAPQPAVAAAGCDHRTDARIDLSAGATLRWREEIVLGRHGEPSGRCSSRLDVILAGAAAYRRRTRRRPPADRPQQRGAGRRGRGGIRPARGRGAAPPASRDPRRPGRAATGLPGRRGDGDRPGRRDHGPQARRWARNTLATERDSRPETIVI